VTGHGAGEQTGGDHNMQMIKMKGSRQEIIQKWQEAYKQMNPLSEMASEVFARLFDEMLEHSPDFSDDEAFLVLNNQFDPKYKFLTPNAEYFISISSSTWLLCSLYAALSGNAVISAAMTLFEKLAGIHLLEAPCVKKLEAAVGESCIILEAANNRKKGIDKNIFKKNKGECIYACLNCNYMAAETGKCKCAPSEAAKILDKLAEESLLVKKRQRYFYNDVL